MCARKDGGRRLNSFPSRAKSRLIPRPLSLSYDASPLHSPPKALFFPSTCGLCSGAPHDLTARSAGWRTRRLPSKAKVMTAMCATASEFVGSGSARSRDGLPWRSTCAANRTGTTAQAPGACAAAPRADSPRTQAQPSILREFGPQPITQRSESGRFLIAPGGRAAPRRGPSLARCVARTAHSGIFCS